MRTLLAVSLVILLAGCSSAKRESELEYRLGCEAIRRGDTQEAFRHLDKSIVLHPTAKAHAERAAAYLLSGEPVGAGRELRKARELKPSKTTLERIEILEGNF